jgi:MFS family permease
MAWFTTTRCEGIITHEDEELSVLNSPQAILGGASVFGMITDLDLAVVTDPTTDPPTVSTKRLSWASSLFYFGMLAGVVPLTYLFQRLHLGRTVGSVIIIWGAVAMSTAGVTSWRGLYAQRFFLGFLESIMPTAFMVVVSGCKLLPDPSSTPLSSET